MMLLLGRIYRELGVYDRAQPLLERALAMRTSSRDETTDAVAEAMAELARLWQDKGRPEEAERLHRDVLAMRRSCSHAGPCRRGQDAARSRVGAREPRQATTRQRRSSAKRSRCTRRSFGGEHAEIASDLEGLQSILRARGQIDAAIPIARRALDMRLKVLGPDHLETATAMNNLAILLYEKWELPEAERLYRQVLDFDLRRLGEVHPNTATVTNNLAFVLRDRGQYDEAERLYRSALDLDRRLFGEEHPYVATVMNNLGDAARAAKAGTRKPNASSESRSRCFERVYGDDHWRIGTVQGGLAGVLSARGDREGRASCSRRRCLSSNGSSLPIICLSNRCCLDSGRHLIEQGDPRAAEPIIRRVAHDTHGPARRRDPRTAEAQVWLGVCLARLGRAPEGRPLLTAGYERLQNEPHFASDALEASRLLTNTVARTGFVPILRR